MPLLRPDGTGKRGLNPPDSVDLNIYELSAEERAEKGIESLPGSLYEAINEIEK